MAQATDSLQVVRLTIVVAKYLNVIGAPRLGSGERCKLPQWGPGQSPLQSPEGILHCNISIACRGHSGVTRMHTIIVCIRVIPL